MSIQITPNLLRKWGSCYNTETHKRIFARHGTISATPITIASWEDVPIRDRLWVLLRKDILPEKEIQYLALSFAEHVLPIWTEQYPNDPHVPHLLETIGVFLVGAATQEDVLIAKHAIACAVPAAAGAVYAANAITATHAVAAAAGAAGAAGAYAANAAAAGAYAAANAAAAGAYAAANAAAAGAYAAAAIDAADAAAAAAGAYAADAEQKWQIAAVVKMLQKRKERDSNAKI